MTGAARTWRRRPKRSQVAAARLLGEQVPRCVPGLETRRAVSNIWRETSIRGFRNTRQVRLRTANRQPLAQSGAEVES